MANLPVVLVHGYSDKGEGFSRWRQTLEAQGREATTIHIGNYISLSNEVSIKDIAEGFDRALLERAGLKAAEPFDAIVHSTGMLVVREWLTAYSANGSRLKHLIGLAPATFGSPMAHKGRSWLGAIFKGGKELGPDFLEAGDLVLSGLELGSRYTWDLAHRDFLSGDEAVFGPTNRTPYPFIIIGLKDYGWVKRAVTEPGTDGTVRWAGAGFNTRKIVADLTVDPHRRDPRARTRMRIESWRNAIVPLVFSADVNHGTILREPTPDLIKMVLDALSVTTSTGYAEWQTKWQRKSHEALAATKAKKFQQFVTHAVDERGDGIRDYFLQIGTVEEGKFKTLEFDLDVHAFREDPSYRCFHVELDRLGLEKGVRLALRVIAESGTELVSYQGYSSSPGTRPGKPDLEKWDAVIEFDQTLGSKEVSFFWPYTTSLVEIRMNREPMSVDGVNSVFWFAENEVPRLE